MYHAHHPTFLPVLGIAQTTKRVTSPAPHLVYYIANYQDNVAVIDYTILLLWIATQQRAGQRGTRRSFVLTERGNE